MTNQARRSGRLQDQKAGVQLDRSGRLAERGAEGLQEEIGLGDDVEGQFSLNWKSQGVPVVQEVNSLFQLRLTPWK